MAAKRGALIGARVAGLSLLRLGALSVPGLGAAITLAAWMIDPDERKALNNFIASTIGGGSEAPAIDAAPSPPRTYFLPLTHDGNRDPVIEDKDHGMVRANDATFGYNPDDVWPTSNPAVVTTSDFSGTVQRFNALSAKLTALCESLPAVYQSAPDEQYVAAAWANTKPGLDALADFQSSQLPAIGQKLMAGAKSANDAYQGFRGINQQNRRAINNSTSGLIPFTANHVDAGAMSDATSEMKKAVDDMEHTAASLASAADTLSIKPNRAAASTAGEVKPAQTDPQPAPASPEAPLAPTAGSTGMPPASPSAPPTAEEPNKDLASLLRGLGGGSPMGGGFPSIPGLGGGGMPQIPGLGSGMPQVPGLGAGGPKPLDDDEKDALRKALHDKDKGPDDAKKAPGDPVSADQPSVAATPGHAEQVKSQEPAKVPAAQPASNTTTDIAGRKWTFDNPKLAALAHNLTGTGGAGNKSVTQAASEAVFKLPPPGQDIGQNIPVDEIKPGDLIMGANNHNGVFLGTQDG
ncbi:MAG: hypothetical protein PHQ28_05035, partial [Mycobacterium sp.]|nr:hypothetical protein [Mycobacterium sp.]